MTNIQRRRGDTWTIQFRIQNGWLASQFSGIKFTVRTKYPASSVTDDSDAVIQKSLGDGIAIDSQDDTLGTVTVPATETQLNTSRYVWDIQATRGSVSPQQVYTLNSGDLYVTADVTRST